MPSAWSRTAGVISAAGAFPPDSLNPVSRCPASVARCPYARGTDGHHLKLMAAHRRDDMIGTLTLPQRVLQPDLRLIDRGSRRCSRVPGRPLITSSVLVPRRARLADIRSRSGCNNDEIHCAVFPADFQPFLLGTRGVWSPCFRRPGASIIVQESAMAKALTPMTPIIVSASAPPTKSNPAMER